MAGKGNVVAKAWVQIIPEMDGIQRTIASEFTAPVEKEGEKAGKSSGKRFSSAFRSAVGALAGIAAAVGFGDLVSGAAEAADATQKFKSTLDFAGLGQSEIDSLSASTRAYADETVYALSDIQNVTAQLAANSVPNFDKLAEAAGNLNAVAGGNADTFKSVGMVLTQTAGAGKLTTENWNQLSDAIPGASGKLQEAMKAAGAYTGNFRDAMAEGQITAEEFNQAIMDLGMTDAAKEAATSASTFEGAFGQLQATVEGGLADILTTLQPAITGLVNSLSGALGPALEGVNAVLQQVTGALQDGATPLEALSAGLRALPAPAQAAVGAIAAIGGAFAAYKIATTAVSAANGIKGLVSAFGQLTGKAAPVAPAVAPLSGATQLLGSVSAISATQILALAAAVLAVGGAVLLASAGLYIIAASPPCGPACSSWMWRGISSTESVCSASPPVSPAA